MRSADTNLFIYAADPDSPHHEASLDFFMSVNTAKSDFLLCELILVELYMQLRNPAIFATPYSPTEAAGYCSKLKACPYWRCVDYSHEISRKIWHWAERDNGSFRRIIDARIALTLRHHGVTEFATANVKDFKNMGFQKVWNPLKESI